MSEKETQHAGEATMPFSPEHIIDFINKNRYEITNRPAYAMTKGCIDDREHRQKGFLPDVAIPGAGLGVVITALGALDMFRNTHGVNEDYSISEFMNNLERAIGRVTYHSDDGDYGDDCILCVGCGHAEGALTKCDVYGIHKNDAKFILENYLHELNARGVSPDVYFGSHNATAVVVIEDTTTGIPAQDGSGLQVYRYHSAWHKRILDDVCEHTYGFMKKLFPKLSSEEYRKCLADVAEKQLKVTVEHLAKGKPVVVVQDEKIYFA